MRDKLSGKRVLIVEDEYFIASDLKRAFEKNDAVVVGPTGDLLAAMSLLDGAPLDAAVLDVNLEGTTSLPVADVLEERSVPYMFLTGYDGWALPDAYRHIPRVAKPFSMQAVVQCVEGLLERHAP